MPFVTSSFLLLVARPLLLVAMPGAPSSVLYLKMLVILPSCRTRCPGRILLHFCSLSLVLTLDLSARRVWSKGLVGLTEETRKPTRDVPDSLGTSASLLVTSALLVVTRSY